MDLTNRTFLVSRLAVNNIERKSSLEVIVYDQISSSVKVQKGVYSLELDKAFTGIDDPQLSLAVKDVLETIPE